MTRVILFPSAKKDLLRARQWYRDQRPGLDREFRAEVEKALGFIAENPRLYPVVYQRVRRAITRRFPYKIFYEDLGHRILILAVRHHSQRPLVGLEVP